jgi:hypothetical protein
MVPPREGDLACKKPLLVIHQATTSAEATVGRPHETRNLASFNKINEAQIAWI